jgi:hypothetical protein
MLLGPGVFGRVNILVSVTYILVSVTHILISVTNILVSVTNILVSVTHILISVTHLGPGERYFKQEYLTRLTMTALKLYV